MACIFYDMPYVFFSLRGSVEKMRGKMFCAMRLSLKNIVSSFSVCQVILMKKT